VWQFPGKTFWSGKCFSSPCSLLSSFKVELAWHFCPVPKNLQSVTHSFKDRKTFSWWVQKHLKPFAIKSARKIPLTLDEESSLSELHLPSSHKGRVFPYGDTKCTIVGTRDCYSRFLCSYLQWIRQMHILASKPQSDNLNSLDFDKEFTLLWSEKYTGTHSL
jgi:hypothetical protein